MPERSSVRIRLEEWRTSRYVKKCADLVRRYGPDDPRVFSVEARKAEALAKIEKLSEEAFEKTERKRARDYWMSIRGSDRR